MRSHSAHSAHGTSPWVANFSAPRTSLESLRDAHASLEMQLASVGFSEPGMTRASRMFSGEPPLPRHYADAPWRLPPSSVRVLALPLADELLSDAAARRLSRLALRAAEELAGVLPMGTQSWTPSLRSLHVTLFHPGAAPGTSRDSAPPTPSPRALHHELELAQRLAASVPANLTLLVDRFVITSGGVLLLLFLPDHNGACVEALRAAAGRAFPSNTRHTSGLIHASLLRVVVLPPGYHGAAADVARAATAVCERWTRRLRGVRISLRGLLYVREQQIMTLAGESWRMRFGERGRTARP